MPYHSARETDQLALPFMLGEEALRDAIERASGSRVLLKLTDNSVTMVSVRPGAGGIGLRLHRMFLMAGDHVIEELARFIRERKGRTPAVRAFIQEHHHLLGKTPARKKTAVNTAGKYHDLSLLAERVNSRYFGGRISSKVLWGSAHGRGYVRRRTLGSYNCAIDTIRINPVLDRKDVPGYFVEFIIYHEMLHALIPVGTRHGRRVVHSKEFRRREREFGGYWKARAWEVRRC